MSTGVVNRRPTLAQLVGFHMAGWDQILGSYPYENPIPTERYREPNAKCDNCGAPPKKDHEVAACYYCGAKR